MRLALMSMSLFWRLRYSLEWVLGFRVAFYVWPFLSSFASLRYPPKENVFLSVDLISFSWLVFTLTYIVELKFSFPPLFGLTSPSSAYGAGFTMILISLGVTTTSFSRMCLLVPCCLCFPYGSAISPRKRSISLYAFASSFFRISFSPTMLDSFVSGYIVMRSSYSLSRNSSSSSTYSSIIFSTSSHFFSLFWRKYSLRSNLSCNSWYENYYWRNSSAWRPSIYWWI